MHQIPIEIKSETKIGFGVYISDLIFIGFYFMVFSMFESLVDQRMVVFYHIYNIFIAFILTRRSSLNPQKKIYEMLLIRLLKLKEKRYVYLP